MVSLLFLIAIRIRWKHVKQVKVFEVWYLVRFWAASKLKVSTCDWAIMTSYSRRDKCAKRTYPAMIARTRVKIIQTWLKKILLKLSWRWPDPDVIFSKRYHWLNYIRVWRVVNPNFLAVHVGMLEITVLQFFWMNMPIINCYYDYCNLVLSYFTAGIE